MASGFGYDSSLLTRGVTRNSGTNRGRAKTIGDTADSERARTAIRRILDIYIEKDYGLASVTLLEGERLGETNLVFEIFEGPKTKVASIHFNGNQFFTVAQLQTKIAAREPMSGRFGGNHADAIDSSKQKLVELYQSQGFFEAKVTPFTRPRSVPGTIDLTFSITEGLRYQVRNVIITGNTQLKTEALREGLVLQPRGPFIGALQQADQESMYLKYRKLGLNDVTIDCEQRFVDERGRIDLVYKIKENPAP